MTHVEQTIANKALDSRFVRTLVRPLWRMALARHLIVVELFSALVAIIPFGLIPLVSGDTLTRAPGYHVLFIVMQFLFGAYANTGFGLLFIALGVFQAVGYVSGSLHIRLIAAIGSAFMWSFVGLLIVRADWHSTGWTYILLGIFMLWVRIRLALLGQ